jgi:hypothetical protein
MATDTGNLQLVNVFEELLPVQTEAYLLGLSLKLQSFEIEAIVNQYARSKERLYEVLKTFFQRAKTPPTWRTFIEALDSKTVEHHSLAAELRKKYCPPSPVEQREVVRSSDSGPRVVGGGKGTFRKQLDHEVAAFRDQHHRLLGKFSHIVSATISDIYTKKSNIKIKYLVNVLTQSHGAHKSFPTQNLGQLCKVQSYDELFLLLNKCWNFLTYDLLDKLILQLSYRFYSFHSIKTQLQAYKIEVRLFKKSTSLKVFCDGLTNDRNVPLRIAKKVRAYNWPNRVTLENVEVFRQRYSLAHSLERCARIVFQVLQSR